MGLHDRDYHRAGGGGFGGGGLGHPQGRGTPGAGFSAVTWLLIINAGVFLLSGVLTGSRRGGGLSPYGWGAFTIADGVYGLQLWRALTYQFLHAGLFHVLFNMIALYFFGPLMERWWGTRRFVAFYLICGLGGAALYTVFAFVPGLLEVEAETPMVGASACIFGILVGCAMKYPDMRVMLLIPPVPLRLRTLALGLLALAALSMIVGARNAGGEAAHLGGAALGWLLMQRPRLLDWAGAGGSGSPLGKLSEQVRRARDRRRRARDSREEEEVDRILAKVKDKGLGSLTPKEKKILQEATERKQDAGSR